MSESVKIGDTLHWFDENRRVYKRGPDGRAIGGPIYVEHFQAEAITDETPGTWLLGDKSFPQRTVNKKTLRGRASRGWEGVQYYTAEGRADKTWVDSHRHLIRDLLNQASADQLRQIAAILGYAP